MWSRFKEIDPIIHMLFVGIWMSILTLIFVERFFKEDAQIFQIIASLIGGFQGGFLAKIDITKKPAPAANTETHLAEQNPAPITSPVNPPANPPVNPPIP